MSELGLTLHSCGPTSQVSHPMYCQFGEVRCSVPPAAFSIPGLKLTGEASCLLRKESLIALISPEHANGMDKNKEICIDNGGCRHETKETT